MWYGKKKLLKGSLAAECTKDSESRQKRFVSHQKVKKKDEKELRKGLSERSAQRLGGPPEEALLIPKVQG